MLQTTQVQWRVAAPCDLLGVFEFLAARAIGRVEVVEIETSRLRYARSVALAKGAGTVEVEAAPVHDGWDVVVSASTHPADADAALAAVRRLLDLDHDAVAADAALRTDPALRPLVAAVPGVRVPGVMDADELIIRALIGQQISVSAARTHLTRLAAHAGSPVQTAVIGVDRMFPGPRQLVEQIPVPPSEGLLDPDRPLRLPRRSINTVRAAAAALADGSVRVDGDRDPAELKRELVALPGIGPWTAAYVAMRVSNDPDAWLTGDVALVAGAKTAGILDPMISKAAAHRVLAQYAQRWSPWRSYAAMHLWRVAAPK